MNPVRRCIQCEARLGSKNPGPYCVACYTARKSVARAQARSDAWLDKFQIPRSPTGPRRL